METKMITLAERMRNDGIRMQATHVAERVAGAGDWNEGWPHDEWRCTFSIPHSQVKPLTITFRQGIGHDGARPEKDVVMDAVLSDASGVADGETYTEWCGEFGLDPDSRRAEKTYVACRKQTERLRAFLGTRFEAYLRQTERL